jgi:YegS/Rv2252/BmrU family lipid kinase
MTTDESKPTAPRRDLFIIRNPAAGQRRAGLYTRTVAALEGQGCRATVRDTTGPGAAEALAREAAAGDFDAVVVAGGDGTIAEAANGLVGTTMPLGLIPLGTANVLAAEIGWPTAADAIAAALVAGPARPVHIGRANGRAFTLMAEAGFNAHVVRNVNLALKRRVGKAAYVWSAIGLLLRQQPVLYDVEADGHHYRAAAVVVAKGHLYGGRFVFAPDAWIAAPSFELCLAERPGRWNTLRYGAGLVFGFLPRLSGYRVETVHRVTITGPAGDPVQCDGDDATELPVTIELDPVPLNLIVPGS